MKTHPTLRPTDLDRRPVHLERRAAGPSHETRSYALQIKATGDDGAVEGYGSVFGHKDSYDDVIANGAFAASLKAHRAEGTMPAMLWQHDSSQPIGIWTDMIEDARGLRIVGKLALDRKSVV
jgi:phage head maturation protease